MRRSASNLGDDFSNFDFTHPKFLTRAATAQDS